jgi:N-methylhydantoinase B
LPDGVYAYQTYLDNSGDSAEPLLLRLKLTVSGDEIHADFTGSAPQVSGPANLGPAPATTATFTMTKALLDPSGPINAGAQRPLKVTAPLGSVVNARPPAACGAIGEVRRALESLVVGTLGMAIPERLVGDLKGASNLISISGRHPMQQEDFLFVEFPAGGTGGTSRTDGNNSMRNFAEGDISSIQPIEALEASCPLRVERMLLRQDSGGPGRHRGGLGLQREIRVLGEHAQLSVLSDKNLIPPYGVRGGWTGAPNRFTVLRDGEEIEPSPLPGKVTGFALRTGDVVIERTAGGGGYGYPVERDAQAVVRDVCFGYVSAASAQAAYGITLRDGNEDAEATKALRVRLRAQRVELRAILLDAEERAGSRLTLQIAPPVAQRLDVSDGDLVEVARDNGPSLLGWARIAADVPEDACALAASAAPLLRLAHDDRIAVRRVDDQRR